MEKQIQHEVKSFYEQYEVQRQDLLRKDAIITRLCKLVMSQESAIEDVRRELEFL